MPNILIGYKGKFEPFSFEELLTPVAYATEQQNAYEQAYEKMYDTADAIASQLSDGDVNSLSIYNNYNAKLQEAGKQLMEKGFNDPNVKKMLKDARKDFNNGMLKVGSAVEQRNKDLAARQNLMLAHPNIKVSPVGSVDEYLSKSNKPMTSVDLNTQYTKGINAGKGITSRMYSSPEFRNGMMLIKHGLASPNEVMNMLRGLTVTDENGNTTDFNSEFQTAINSLMISSGMDNLSKEDQDAVTSSIMDGIIAGMIYDEKWSGIPSSGRSGGGGSGAKNNKGKDTNLDNQFPSSTMAPMLGNTTKNKNTAEKSDKKYKNKTLKVGIVSPNYGITGSANVNNQQQYIDVGFLYEEYDGGGGIMSREDFLNRAKREAKKRGTTLDTQSANAAYNDFYNYYHNQLGLNVNSKWDKEYQDSYDRFVKSGTGLNVNGFELMAWEDNDNKTLKHAIAPASTTGKGTKITQIKEVKGVDGNKKLQFTGKMLTTKKDKTIDDNIDLNAYTRFFVNPALTDSEGTPYVFAQQNGKLFAIPAYLINEEVAALIRAAAPLYKKGMSDADLREMTEQTAVEDLGSDEINAIVRDFNVDGRMSYYEAISNAFYGQAQHHYTDANNLAK